MATPLPQTPDFEMLDAAAATTAEQRSRILSVIGNIVFAWSNNESMFIYVIMVLMETDEVTAAIVFGTLGTTRARIELVHRLSRAKLADPALTAEIDTIIDRFNKMTRLRNDLNHCMYSVNERGEITQTHSMRIQERNGRMRLGVLQRMDSRRLQRMQGAVHELKLINRALWDILPRIRDHIATRRAKANVAE